jgi:thiosulfate reductase cytochrome b subunit
MEILIYSVFGFFGVHTLFWFVRSLVHTFSHKRPKRLAAGQPAYIRFAPFHRALHLIVIVSFLGLALTGLPLRYSDQGWAKGLAASLGGFGSTSVWHHVFAVATFFYFAAHLVWLARKTAELRGKGRAWKTILVGPDSPVPVWRDIKDLGRMARWFCGLGPKPVFERWTYWEKFDYWAVFWGVGIIGVSGLMLWFPNFFCRVLPGEALNAAKVVHSEEALLAVGFIFAIHFFHNALRPEKAPVDLSMLTGLTSEEELQEERPEYMKRLRQEGVLDVVRAAAPSRMSLWLATLAGLAAIAVGLALLAGIVVAGSGG